MESTRTDEDPGGLCASSNTRPAREEPEDRKPEGKQVLFLCTGNYYRSRFAEELFNCLAVRYALRWRALSRGLDVDGVSNPGPISRHAVDGLRARGIAIRGEVREPIQASPADLERADCVVAMKEAEHRPLIAQRFPAWLARVEFWHVDDVEFADPADALADLEARVATLIERLAGEASGPVRS